MRLFILFTLFISQIVSHAYAKKDICEVANFARCRGLFGSTFSYLRSFDGISFPDFSSSMQLNPSKLMKSKGLGMEVIGYNGDYSVGVATGTGRVGAAVASISSEGGFFGNSTRETPQVYSRRKLERKKYKGEKFSASTSFDLFFWKKKKKKKKFWKPNISIGLIGNYNQATKKSDAGIGTNLTWGIFTLSASRVGDSYLKPDSPSETIDYYYNSFSIGLRLIIMAIEHTVIDNRDYLEDTVRITSGSLFTPYGILTYGVRTEDSRFQALNYDTKTFSTETTKEEVFYGLQFPLGGSFMLGGYYNYYLNRNLSIAFSGFF